MKKQSRRWLVASVAAALLLSSLVANLDNQKLYHTLQTKLKDSGITLKAEGFSLSAMYLGSIRLDQVSIQSAAFELQADLIYIDMDLAALLTGKALPQALYLSFSDINIKQQQQDEWLQLIATETFKLKRINIAQSEIHFIEQHVTLTQVTLDVRDIGKNKNPRLELQAHIGEGRLDAHGYLRLKRGEITRGFGRLKIHNIPLTFLEHGTTLETLNGSITTHLNQDKSWQSFGHISLQAEQRNELELRGKVTGTPAKFFKIDDMVLNINNAGALQLGGQCPQKDTCEININSKNLNVNPILLLLGHDKAKLTTNNQLQSLAIQTTWNDQLFSSHGEISWPSFDYMLDTTNLNNAIHIDAGTLVFNNLQKQADHQWTLEKAELTNQDDHLEISLNQAHYNNQDIHLPLTLNNTSLWLPLSKLIAFQLGISPPSGEGTMEGNLELNIDANKRMQARIAMDASQADIRWQEVVKPQGITLQVNGSSTWQKELQFENANLSIQLVDSHAQMIYQKPMLEWDRLAVDFNQFAEQGVILPSSIQGWRGYLAGDISLQSEHFDISRADLELIGFEWNKHTLNGAVQKRRETWRAQDLEWTFGTNKAYFSSSRNGRIVITADELNAEGLAYILSSPLNLKGTLETKSLVLPFGPLKDVSTRYDLNKGQLSLARFKSTFYEGSLHATLISLSKQDKTFNLAATFQAGGIHLNNWTWLHKQFQAHLEGSLYATLNLDTNFDESGVLSQWKGDGDVILYNGGWLLNSKNIKADKLELSLRKREQFVSSFKVTHLKQHGSGKVAVDEQMDTTGYFEWDNQKIPLSKTWPFIQYE